MAEVKIEIPNIGEVIAENAASESTLREILKAMDADAAERLENEEIKKTNKNIKTMGKNTEVAGEQAKSFGEKLSGITGGILNLFTSVIGTAIGSVTGLTTELIAGGNQLSSFTQYLPIPGLQMMSGLLDNQVDQFRELSQTGASFGNNMFEITRIAGNAAIPQQEFANLLTTQSESLRLFGNSVNDGARNFASMSKEMRQGGLGPRLMEMGFSTQELNENFIAYSEMMQVSGRRSRMSNQELIQGAQEYSLELDKISKLTGKSRKQLEEEMKQKNLDIRRQMAINKYGEEFGLRLQQASEASPALEAALLDMSDGIANDPLTRQLMANNEAFAAEAQNIQNMSATQMNNFIRRVADDGMRFANTLDEAGVQATVGAGNATGEMLNMVGQIQRTRESAEGTIEDEQNKRDDATAAMATLAETINDIRGKLQVELLDSQIFQDIKNGITEFIPSLDEAKEMYDQASAYFKDNILPTLNETWNWLKTDGLEMAKTVFTELQGMWNEYFPQIKQFVMDLFNDPGKVWEDTILPLIKDGLSNIFGDFDWVAFGATLLLGLTALNPFGALATTLIAGIVGYFGWDNIKEFFVEKYTALKDMFQESIDDAIVGVKQWFGDLWDGLFAGDFDVDIGGWIGQKVDGIMNWFAGLFDINWGAIADEYVPGWMKKFLPESWFSGPTDSSSPAPMPSGPESPEVSSNNTSDVTPPPVTSNSNTRTETDNPLLALNTNTETMIELMRTQNKLIRDLNQSLV